MTVVTLAEAWVALSFGGLSRPGCTGRMFAFYGCKLLKPGVWRLMEGHLDLEPVLCRDRLQLEGTFVYFSGPENYCLKAGRTMLMGPPSWRRFKSR